MGLSGAHIRKIFPSLQREVHGKRYAFLDSAASAQMPQTVIQTVVEYHQTIHANVHRGVYEASVLATDRFEQAREDVRRFIGARHREEIIFTSGTTDAINLVASTWGNENLKAGDTILTTILEHHSNLVPWQQLARRTGAQLVFVELTPQGLLDMDRLHELLQAHQPKLVTVTMMSNALGTITPAKDIVAAAHNVGARVLLDGAQGIPHSSVKIAELGADFLAFSAHKMCGPTGVGVLYGKKELLQAMPPYRFGGDMILQVKREFSQWNELPYKFEAGTPNISGVIGLGEAIRFLEGLGMENVANHERKLMAYALSQLRDLPGIKVYGCREPHPLRGGVISFGVEGIHPHDVGTMVDAEGVAMRVGHHCAQPLMEYLNVPATVRLSLYVYNDEEDVDQCMRALKKAQEYFRRG